MPFRLGPMELIILLVVVMMIFGVGRLPQVGGALGKSLKEFRKVQADTEDLVNLKADTSPKEVEAGKS